MRMAHAHGSDAWLRRMAQKNGARVQVRRNALLRVKQHGQREREHVLR
jgi:hypothetical protein